MQLRKKDAFPRGCQQKKKMRNIEQLLRDLKEKLKEVEKNSGAKDVETRREFNEVVQQLASLTGGAPETRSSRAQAAAAAPASQAPIVNPAEANTEAPKAAAPAQTQSKAQEGSWGWDAISSALSTTKSVIGTATSKTAGVVQKAWNAPENLNSMACSLAVEKCNIVGLPKDQYTAITKEMVNTAEGLQVLMDNLRALAKRIEKITTEGSKCNITAAMEKSPCAADPSVIDVDSNPGCPDRAAALIIRKNSCQANKDVKRRRRRRRR